MPLAGAGFLAIWNDHTDRTGAYDVWHTREHVGERLGVPGFLWARRYHGGDRKLPAYFTLYGLDDISALDSQPYQRLLAGPTPWSTAMRPGMRNFLRRACRLTMSVGAGTGGLMATVLTRLSAAHEEAAAKLASMALPAPVTAVHLGRIDPGIAPVGFAGDEPEFAAGADTVLLVEGYSAGSFASGVNRLVADLRAAGPGNGGTVAAIYALAFALDATERDRMPTLPDGTV